MSSKVTAYSETSKELPRFISQREFNNVERDGLSDGYEYNPKSRDVNRLAIKKPKEFNGWGRNKVKLDRNERALVRALAKRGKWEHKEIAAVFHVSLPLIKRTVANSYTVVNDREWQDEDFYNQSDLEELISGRLPPAPEKKSKRKAQVTKYARSSNKSAQEVRYRQCIATSPSTSVSMEVEVNSNKARGIFTMFRDEAILVHGEKVHSILEEIGIQDDETMFAVLTMDDEHLNGMLQEARRLNLVERFSVIQAMRNFGRNHEIAK
ncbi:hypothetical protein EDD22DRAFT_937836 [Suillus occidentalis]|nr:hypothetical protein EDD22DRAFT_937836 [Suillus occidentalis]